MLRKQMLFKGVWKELLILSYQHESYSWIISGYVTQTVRVLYCILAA